MLKYLFECRVDNAKQTQTRVRFQKIFRLFLNRRQGTTSDKALNDFHRQELQLNVENVLQATTLQLTK